MESLILENFPILYSFRRCPYAMRARLALWLSDRVVEIREIDLKSKPSAMLAISPKGTVPVLLCTDARVLDESRDIMEWALAQNDPQNCLANPVLRAKLTELIDKNDQEFKIHLDHYKYPERFPPAVSRDARQRGEEFLQLLEDCLHQHSFLISSQLSLADIAIMPFVRQFALVDKSWFMDSPYPKLLTWLQDLEQSDIFDSIMQKFPIWTEQSTPLYFGKKT
ncbi:MAG: glutathione S-transferase [Proteobacteria bacterium]|nr:glutathione S-transferase [Pseudomonadota bacterium]